MIHWIATYPMTDLAFVIFAFAMVCGGLAERLGAGLMIADWLLEFSVDRLQAGGFIAVVPTVFCDFVFACGLLAIALRFGKLWLGVAMILQGVMLAMHALALGDDAPGYNFYVAILNLTTLLLLLCLLSGAVVSWRRRRWRLHSPVAA